MFYDAGKRIIDILGSLLLGVIFLPVCAVTALAIKLDSQGPIFADTPKRKGKNGKLFKLYKFRSMVVNAHHLLRTKPQFKKLYKKYKEGNYKLKDDPRVTRVGKFIRKHSLDEIPQLFNVLKGEMSLVGPRPYYPDELEEQQKKYPQTKKLTRTVLSVKPGITGVWQVSGRSEINFDQRMKMDALYSRRRSLFFDLTILLKSPWVMLTGKGAV